MKNQSRTGGVPLQTTNKQDTEHRKQLTRCSKMQTTVASDALGPFAYFPRVSLETGAFCAYCLRVLQKKATGRARFVWTVLMVCMRFDRIVRVSSTRFARRGRVLRALLAFWELCFCVVIKQHRRIAPDLSPSFRSEKQSVRTKHEPKQNRRVSWNTTKKLGAERRNKQFVMQ